MHERGTRDRIVVQPRDVPEAGRQVHRGLPVRSIEGAVFRGVLVDAHGHVESSINVRDRARKLHVESIAGATNHRKAIRFRETDQGIIIFLARTEPRGKLRHRYEVPIGGAGRIVELL